jgi:hypothetical protein
MPASPWRTFGSPEPEREYVALLSFLPLEQLLADSSFLPVYRASDEAIGISGRHAGLFGSRSPALEAILDALGLEERGGAANFHSVSTACAHHDRSHSTHGRDQVRTLDG